MSVASDSRTIVIVMLLFVENEYKIAKTVRSLGVSGVTPNYLNINVAIESKNIVSYFTDAYAGNTTNTLKISSNNNYNNYYY